MYSLTAPLIGTECPLSLGKISLVHKAGFVCTNVFLSVLIFRKFHIDTVLSSVNYFMLKPPSFDSFFSRFFSIYFNFDSEANLRDFR